MVLKLKYKNCTLKTREKKVPRNPLNCQNLAGQSSLCMGRSLWMHAPLCLGALNKEVGSLEGSMEPLIFSDPFLKRKLWRLWYKSMHMAIFIDIVSWSKDSLLVLKVVAFRNFHNILNIKSCSNENLKHSFSLVQTFLCSKSYFVVVVVGCF